MPTINKKQIRSQGRASELDNKVRRSIYNSERWRRLRHLHLLQHPLCAECLRNGIVRQATDVHHVRSFMSGLTPEHRRVLAYDAKNLESLCKTCHQAEHHVRHRGIGG